MKDFYLHLKNRIETQIPGLKVQLWNDQFRKANGTDEPGRKEMAIKYPICYIELIVDQINNYSRGIKDYFLRVRFRIGLESYKFERLETFDFVDDFYRAIHLYHPPLDSGLAFTSLQEVQFEQDTDHHNVEIPHIDYRTKMRTVVTYTPPIEALDIDLEITPDVTETIE
jgi:hypothetical protein